jgi:hypothetical protein
MSNRIKSVALRNAGLDPIEAEIWILVEPEKVTASTEVRGRLVGPRCHYSTTVEVAYPMRAWSKEYPTIDRPSITMRVIIPEPSLWDPDSPLFYEGPLELWQKGKCVDRKDIRHGLRTMRLGPRGLRINDRPLTLHGMPYGELSKDKSTELRQSKCNVLLTSLSGDVEALWANSDQLGFLRIGRITNPREIAKTAVLSIGAMYASDIGWLVTEEVLKHEVLQAIGLLPLQGIEGLTRTSDSIIGIELTRAPAGPLPEGTSFLACREELLPSLAEFNLPVLLLSDKPLPPEPPATPSQQSPIVLGTIYAFDED